MKIPFLARKSEIKEVKNSASRLEAIQQIRMLKPREKLVVLKNIKRRIRHEQKG